MRCRVQKVGTTAVCSYPDGTIVRLENSHDSRCADTVGVDHLNWNLGKYAIRCQFEQAVGHGADPQIAIPVTPEGHHARITERIDLLEKRVDVLGRARVGIEKD